MSERNLSPNRWPESLAGLERLRLSASGPASSALPGRRRGRTVGLGIDFADFQRYSPGDDIRYLDWSLYARLRKLYSRRFHAESELAVHLLVDVSASMGLGGASKLAYARRLARSLAYVGLRNLDPVGLATFSDRLLDVLPPRRAGGQLHEIHRRIEESEAGGRTDLDRALREYGGRARRRGLAMVISDLLSTGGYAEGLEFLLYKGLRPVVIQILAPEDLDPPLPERADLQDAEEPGLPRLAVDREVLAQYLRDLARSQAEQERFCLDRGVTLVRLISNGSLAEMTRSLLEAGVWQAH